MEAPIARALIATGKHTVTALVRVGGSGKAGLPEGIHETATIDYADEASLSAAMAGQDLVVITLPAVAPPQAHSQLVRAAARAGVKFVMPNAYGGDPVVAVNMINDTMPGQTVMTAPGEIAGLGMRSLVLVCGFWYEWSLGIGQNGYGFNFGAGRPRSVTLFDDGNVKINTSTWKLCGQAVAAALSLPILPRDGDDKSPTLSALWDSWEDPATGFIRVSSFLVSQRDLWASLKRVTATTDADWAVRSEPSAERFAAARKALVTGDRAAFGRQLYTRAFFPNDPANFEAKSTLRNDFLGLPKEDMDEATREAIRLVDSGELPYFG